VGQEFDLDVLLGASGRAEAEVLNALEAALEARVLEEVRGSNERYAFGHALIHQTLYEELPAHRRRRLHLRVAEVLEGLHGRQATAATELARHFLLGNHAERAANYSVLAGDYASGR
jgi:predicted ATPase